MANDQTTPHTITYVAGEPSRFGVAVGGGGSGSAYIGSPDKELWVTARPQIQSALRRGLIFGLLAGIPLGWAVLPFVLGAMGATMEFHW